MKCKCSQSFGLIAASFFYMDVLFQQIRFSYEGSRQLFQYSFYQKGACGAVYIQCIEIVWSQVGVCALQEASHKSKGSRMTFSRPVGKRLARQSVNNYVRIRMLLFIYYVFNCLPWHYVPPCCVSEPFNSVPPLSLFFYIFREFRFKSTFCSERLRSLYPLLCPPYICLNSASFTAGKNVLPKLTSVGC